jgi:hypothetical protein
MRSSASPWPWRALIAVCRLKPSARPRLHQSRPRAGRFAAPSARSAWCKAWRAVSYLHRGSRNCSEWKAMVTATPGPTEVRKSHSRAAQAASKVPTGSGSRALPRSRGRKFSTNVTTYVGRTLVGYCAASRGPSCGYTTDLLDTNLSVAGLDDASPGGQDSSTTMAASIIAKWSSARRQAERRNLVSLV